MRRHGEFFSFPNQAKNSSDCGGNKSMPPPPRTRQCSRSPEASTDSTATSGGEEEAAMEACCWWCWSRMAERRGTGRICPLWKSSSAEDMAAAEGDGKRAEKSKSRPMPAPRAGLVGGLKKTAAWQQKE